LTGSRSADTSPAVGAGTAVAAGPGNTVSAFATGAAVAAEDLSWTTVATLAARAAGAGDGAPAYAADTTDAARNAAAATTAAGAAAAGQCTSAAACTA
jgi:hypothetical protein